jgi:hypothetical protein
MPTLPSALSCRLRRWGRGKVPRSDHDAREGAEAEVGVDLVVDDDASVVESHGGYRVEPFGGGPWDEELRWVAEAVEASKD